MRFGVRSFTRSSSPCPDGSGALRLTLSWEPSAEDAALVVSRIAVYAEEETPVYTLETARYRKGAAS